MLLNLTINQTNVMRVLMDFVSKHSKRIDLQTFANEMLNVMTIANEDRRLLTELESDTIVRACRFRRDYANMRARELRFEEQGTRADFWDAEADAMQAIADRLLCEEIAKD